MLTYYHACGQRIELKEIMVGYCAWYRTLVNGRAVRYCPRCGKRVWVETLIHPKDMPKRDDSTWGDYLDYQQMIQDLGPMLH